MYESLLEHIVHVVAFEIDIIFACIGQGLE